MLQCLRICLPVQGEQVGSLVCEDSMCCGAAKPMHHNHKVHALGPQESSSCSAVTRENPRVPRKSQSSQ